MRNSHSTSMARSATSTTRTHPQLMTHSTIAEGYDFNRARSSESTEDALAGKPSVAAAAALPAAHSFDASEAEDRGVPMSPKKLPPTPPRDHGSPYRPQEAAATAPMQHPSQDRLLQPRQPFLSSSSSSSPQQPFLRPSSWRHKEEDHGASIFRDSSGHDSMSREHQGFYTIQRSYAFDEDDESDSEF